MKKLYKEEALNKAMKLGASLAIKALEEGKNKKEILNFVMSSKIAAELLEDYAVYERTKEDLINQTLSEQKVMENLLKLNLTTMQKEALKIFIRKNKKEYLTKNQLFDKFQKLGYDTGSSVGGILGGLSKKCEAYSVSPPVLIENDKYTLNPTYRPFLRNIKKFVTSGLSN